MKEKRWEDQYRTTLISIDDYKDRIPVGKLSNPGVEAAIPFYGTMQFLDQMEKLLDGLQFPEAFAQIRKFRTDVAVRTMTEFQPREYSGQIATFHLRVLFRQNASWQGSILWLEGKQEESFRSVLELLMMMDSALMSTGGTGRTGRTRQ